jgi:TolA-binding protein
MRMSEDKKETKSITKEDVEQIEKDIQDAKSSLVSKEVDMKLEEMKTKAKEEALAEIEMQNKLREQEEQNRKLQEQLEAKEKEAAEKLNSLQQKVDEMVGSKAAFQPVDPFKNEPHQSTEGVPDVKRMSDEQVDDIEMESARAFFGDELDERV